MSQQARIAALECQVKELEERLHYLETTWKAGMDSERRNHEKKMAEVVQVLMMQEEMHKQRTAVLESRLDEAIKLCRDTAVLSQQRQTTSAPALTDARAQSPPTGAPTTATATAPTLPEAYQERVNRIFDFYTAGDPLCSQMGMQSFCRLLRDCKVGQPDSGTSPELLWMAVMRALHGGDTAAPQTTVGKEDDRKASLFAHQRRETFGRERFSAALAAVAVELHRLLLLSVDVPAASRAMEQTVQDTFLVFLTGVVFPRTTAAMLRASPMHENGGQPQNGAAHYEDVIRMYDAAADTKAVLRQNAQSIKKAFEAGVAASRGGPSSSSSTASSTPGRLTIEGLADTARRYKLLSNLPRTDIRAIFDCCVAWEHVDDSTGDNAASHAKPSDVVHETGPASISLPAFVKALCCVAECIYGDPSVVSLYPTPASRVAKLMTKMFVLS